MALMKAECDIKGYMQFLALYSKDYEGMNILMDAHVEWNKLVERYPLLNGIKLVKKYALYAPPPKRASSAYNMFTSLFMRIHKGKRGFMGFKQVGIVWKALKSDNPDADGQTLFNIFKKEIEEKSANLIQSSWKRAISNPVYKVCRDRLMSEFNTM